MELAGYPHSNETAVISKCENECSMVFGYPGIEAGLKLPTAFSHGLPAEPLVHGLPLELQKNAFALVFRRGQPGHLASQGRTPDSEVQFAFDVRSGRLEACEAHLGHDFS